MMRKVVSIFSLALAGGWVAWGFCPFPKGWDPDGYNRLFGLVFLSALFLVPGIASLILWFREDVRWSLPISLLAVPVFHLLGAETPWPGNLVLFFVPLGVMMFCVGKALRG